MNARNLSNRCDRDLEWITNPQKWPRWPLCPMKRPQEGEPLGQCAVLVGEGATDSPRRFVLYEKNLFTFGEGLIAPQLRGCSRFEYDSAEAVLADGWKVD